MRVLKIGPAFLVLLLLSSWSLGQDELPGKKGKDEEITVNLQVVKMDELIEIVQRDTGKIFLYDEHVQRLDVSFKGGQAIPRKALFSVFKSILETRGYGISETFLDGLEVCKIAQSRQTFTGPAQTFSGEDIKANPDLIPRDDTMVTVVYSLRYAEARTAANQLRQIVNAQKGGNILGIPNVNVVVVTAFGSVMQRVFRIIDLLDVPGPQLEWKVVKIEHADPEVVANKVESILQAGHMQARNRQLQAQPPGKLVPELRTHSIIIQALPDQFPDILSLVKKLDVKLEKEPSEIHVIPLEHTNALDLEGTINAIIQANPDIGVSEDAAGTPEAAPMPVPPLGVPPSSVSGTISSRKRRVPRLPRRSGAGMGAGEERAAAIADESTNSLIIVAPEPYFRELKKIIDRLDVRRPQVLIETLFVEVSSTSSLTLGAELAVLDRAAEGRVRGFGATAFGLSNIVDQDGKEYDPTGGEEGEIPIPMGRLPNLQNSRGMMFGVMAGKQFKIPILLSLLGRDSNVNILSMPRILTNANEKAEIKIINEVPTSTSQSSAAVSNITGFGGFQEAGTTLVITPYIAENDSLRLEIEQTIEEFGPPDSGGGAVLLPPPKTSREIKSEVTVPNHRTVILGGLTSTITRDECSKIPLLGDIPLIGILFRTSYKETVKQNLYVFITPHILNDPKFRDLERLSDEAMKEARGFGVETSQIDRHFRDGSLEDEALESGRPGKAVDLMEYAPARRRD